MIARIAEPQPRLWTKAEFYRLAELGFFEGQKAELWEGEVVVMSPQNWAHACALDRNAEVLRRAFGDTCWVRSQLPLDLGLATEPEPDISIVPGRREDYANHPTTALLIVEISDSSLAGDRTRKASLYARHGIADYWIVNLVDGQLEVYRQPQADATQPYGFSYADCTVLGRNAAVAPLAMPTVNIPVADLLG